MDTTAEIRAYLMQGLANRADAEAFAFDVSEFLEHHNWDVGQPKGPVAKFADVAEWLRSPEGLIAHALYYFWRHYPMANHLELAAASALIVEIAHPGLYKGMPISHPRVKRVKDFFEFYNWDAPDFPGLKKMNTYTALSLIEWIIFRDVPEEASTTATIREVVDLLNNTRHAFKSKQIEACRKKLEGLLG